MKIYNRIKEFMPIIITPVFYLLLFYIIWIAREINQGRLVTGIIMVVLFNGALIYWAQGLVCLGKKDWYMTALEFFLSAMFIHFWYCAIKMLNESIINNTPCPIAGYNVPGWFGIEGYWGFAIVIPLYWAALVTLFYLFKLYDYYNLVFKFYNFKRGVKRWLRAI